MTRDRARAILDQLPAQPVAVLGDLMLDRYILGHASRISPEAPVPVVRVSARRTTLGGAANVLRNISALGGRSLAFGVVGEDADGDEVRTLCRQWQIEAEGVIGTAGRQTTVKTRLVADRQQLARIDDEEDSPISPELQQALLERLQQAIADGRLRSLIIEDYHKGVVSRELVAEAVRLGQAGGVITSLDPHPGNPFGVHGLTLMTPNRSEAFALAGVYYRPTTLPLEDDAPLLEVATRLIEQWQPRLLLVTLGAAGMALFEGDAIPHHIPTRAREVFDVSGAGDTVIATFTAALAAGATSIEAATLANHAAGIVCGIVGTSAVERDDLLASFADEP